MIFRNFKKNFSIYVDVQMVNSVNNDEYRNTYHIAHDNRTANTRKCLGIAAFGWWITDNNAFFLRKQVKNARKHRISLRWPTHERWKTVVFKRFLRIFCPRKWKETLYLRRKTSFKAIFCYWKATNSNHFPIWHRILNTRKTTVFVELTVKENCWIMERIIQFADSKATGKRWFSCRKMSEKYINNVMQTGILWWNGVAIFVCLFVFFLSKKKGLHQNTYVQ